MTKSDLRHEDIPSGREKGSKKSLCQLGQLRCMFAASCWPPAHVPLLIFRCRHVHQHLENFVFFAKNKNKNKTLQLFSLEKPENVTRPSSRNRIVAVLR